MIQFERLEDLLATAQKMEIGAADRYMEYAEATSAENPEVSALFSRLADEEREHEDQVLRLAEQASVDLSNATVTEQQTSPEQKGSTERVKNSLYEILIEAVKREEHAFEIYSHIATSSKNDDVRRYAQLLAKEELGHASLLRAMRRRVYNEHKVKTRKLPSPDKLDSFDEFLIVTIILEITMAKYIEHISRLGVEVSSIKEHSEFVMNQLLVDIEKSTVLNIVDQFSKSNVLSDDATITLESVLTECESVYEYFDSFILKTDNQDIMNKALFLTSEMLTRLNLLQDIKNKLAA